MTDIKQICARLIELWDADCDINVEINELRAALAESEPEGPTDEEVDAWADQQGFIRGHGDHPCGFWIDNGDAGALVRAAIAR